MSAEDCPQISVTTLIDSFKHSFSSKTASNIFTSHYNKLRSTPTNPLLLNTYPISDGGEGFIDAMSEALNLPVSQTIVSGPHGEKSQSSFLFDPNQGLLILESAQYVGIQNVPKAELNPYKVSTFGLGEMLRQALSDPSCANLSTVILGMGGTASVDCGLGLLQGLFGVQCFDTAGHLIHPYDVRLGDIASVQLPQPPQDRDDGNADPNWSILSSFFNLTTHLASDVTNPLLGPNGATYVYGPQKGVKQDDLPHFESGMRKFSSLLQQTCHAREDLHLTPGCGAAGGIAYALYCMYHDYLFHSTARHFSPPKPIEMHSGFDLLCRYTDISKVLGQRRTILFTGEGKFDSQSLSGKVIQRVAQLVKSASLGKPDHNGVPEIPIVVLCGCSDFDDSPETKQMLYQMGIVKVININDTRYHICGDNIAQCRAEMTLDERLQRGSTALDHVCAYLFAKLLLVNYDIDAFVRELDVG